MDGISESWGFANSLYSQSPLNTSFVFSPLSIALVLSVLHDASKGNTKKQLQEALFKGSNTGFYRNLKANEAQKVTVNLANGIFVNKHMALKEKFLSHVKDAYKARVEKNDFSDQNTVKIINDFVSTATDGHIKSIVESVDATTVAFVVNAILFKADWVEPFAHINEKAPFKGLSGTRQTEVLRRGRFPLDYAEDAQSQFLRIPYKNEDFQFNVILPRENVTFEAFRKSVNEKTFTNLISKVDKEVTRIQLPKFDLTADFDVKDYLEKSGITDIFTDKCDLSELSSVPVKVSEMKHKATISVHENGTIASAASFARVTLKSMIREVYFVADRPFLFAVTFKNVPLFLGQYV